MVPPWLPPGQLRCVHVVRVGGWVVCWYVCLGVFGCGWVCILITDYPLLSSSSTLPYMSWGTTYHVSTTGGLWRADESEPESHLTILGRARNQTRWGTLKKK